MLSDIILGPGLQLSSARFNVRQMADITMETRSLIDDLLADVTARATKPPVDYLDWIIAEEKRLHDEHLPTVQASFEKWARAGTPLKAEPNSATMNVAERWAVYNFLKIHPWYVGFTIPEELPPHFQLHVDMDRQAGTLTLSLKDGDRRFAVGDIRETNFMLLDNALQMYWDHMGKVQTGEVEPSSLEAFDKARRDIHGTNYEIGAHMQHHGIVLGRHVEKALFGLLARTVPDDRNPFPNIILDGYAQVRGIRPGLV